MNKSSYILSSFLGIVGAINSQNIATPNIILILSDDQGWGGTAVVMDPDDLRSASDFNKTPNLQKLAECGMRFTNGYTCHPNCSPSRASILTGKTPARLHFTDIIGRVGGSQNPGLKLVSPRHVNGLQDSLITIAEIIKSNFPQYVTAHFGKWHLGKTPPENHGFDISDGATGNGEGNTRQEGNPKDIFGITQRGCDFMETQVENGKPFYLQLSHYATHLAIQSRAETKEYFSNLLPGIRHNNIEYASMTFDLDAGIGRILEKVDNLGIRENTYIIFLADNGAFPDLNPENTNGPLRGWKATLWEGGIRTPFIVSGPGIPHGTVNKTRVVGWDIFPTICDWLHITNLPEGIDGGSLVKVLTNSDCDIIKRENDFFVFHWPHYVPDKLGVPTSAIIQGNFKLFVSYQNGEVFLYDLITDREETTPLNDKFPEKVIELKRKLDDYLLSVDAGMPRLNSAFKPEMDVMKRVNIKRIGEE